MKLHREKKQKRVGDRKGSEIMRNAKMTSIVILAPQFSYL